jgi:hypothetical protein
VTKEQEHERTDDENEEIGNVEGKAEGMENGDAQKARLAWEEYPLRQTHLQRRLEAQKLAHEWCRERQGKEEDQKPPSPC